MLYNNEKIYFLNLIRNVHLQSIIELTSPSHNTLSCTAGLVEKECTSGQTTVNVSI